MVVAKYEDKALSVSVIMTTYNGARFIGEQIDSILSQNFSGSIKVYIRDDGSTDGTQRIIENYSKSDDRIINVVDNLGNLGVKRGFFHLMELIEPADLIFFSDQDDIWPQNKVQKFLEAGFLNGIVRSSVPGGIYSDLWIADAKGNSTGERMSQRDGWKSGDNNYHFLSARFQVTGAAFAINYAAVQLINELPDEWRAECSMHDAFIGEVLSVIGELIRLDEPLLYYRQHGGNLIGTKKHSFREKLSVVLKMVHDNRNVYMLLSNRGSEFLNKSHLDERKKYFSKFSNRGIAFARVVSSKIRRTIPWYS